MRSRFHYRSKQQLDAYIERLPHALILSGLSPPARQGAVAYLFERLPHSLHRTDIDEEAHSLSIELIRGLYGKLYRRTDEDQLHMVHISRAERLTLPAQNALLKLLEEPPSHVRFIITVKRADHLLPTIRSRAHAVELLPLDPVSFAEHVQQESAVRQLYALTGGDPWLAELIEGQSGSENILQLGKQLLQQPLGEALLEATTLSKEPSTLETIVHMYGQIAMTGLRQSKSAKKKQQWLARLAAVDSVLEALYAQSNQKLLIDKLLLELRSV